MAFAALGWLALRSYLTPKEGDGEEIKGEHDTVKMEDDSDELDLADALRSGSGYERQAPLRGIPTVKDEDSDGSVLDEMAIPPVDGDDEGDDKSGLVGSTGVKADSAIGTSFSESSGSAGLSRRRSRGGQGGS